MKMLKKGFVMFMSVLVAVCSFGNMNFVKAATETYEIYPTPHKITYKNNDFILRDSMNVVYESGIDSYTKDRLNEVASLKGMKVSESDKVQENTAVTNVLVGIKGSGEYVDQYVAESAYGKDLFDKLDSYYLEVKDGTIVVLGKDTDAAFYGLTTLYMVFKQLDSMTISNFTVEDYSDVASRGFIEGYYGNPWSTEDRAELMTWGGYYKLNSYFYAPKDDPKHNAKWRELYTPEEIETKIKPLAEAGNKSKCRFVFALHPYMNNPIRYGSEANYQADLKVMQAKFEQVIEAGVRQIAILADDAANFGGENYIRTLKDMTAWLKEMQKTYPDLKLTLPFCTVEYGGYGESYYSQFPENVQIVMTGGRIWGEVSNQFTESFTNNVGRGPYLWINWPCTDNSKKHLIMGGYDNFLHPGVNPEKIQGIVLNPMQQSEPSKVAIFGNACYSWNIWETKEEADKAWESSFKYVDNNSPIETKTSEAFRELSKHMINQNMDGRVVKLEETVELKEEIEAFNASLADDTVTIEQVESLIEEFEILQDAAKTYRNSGNKRIVSQIVYWLNCWDDTTEAALAYLNGIKAAINADDASLMNGYVNGKTAFDRSKTYGFNYIDHLEYAEVGVQRIVPLLKNMNTYLSEKVSSLAGSVSKEYKFISNAFTNPYSGSYENVFDRNDNTQLVFHEPNFFKKDQYIGVEFPQPMDLESIRISFAGGKNHFYNSKLQYTVDGTNWKDVSDEVFVRPKDNADPIEVYDLWIENVKAVRLILTKDNGDDGWLTINSIDVNIENPNDNVDKTLEIKSIEKIQANAVGGNINNLKDGNPSTEFWLSDPGDCTKVGSGILVDLGEEKNIGSVYFAQGFSAAGDVIDQGKIEVSSNKTDWVNFGTLGNAKEQTVNGFAKGRYVRITNTKEKRIWWRLGEVTISEADAGEPIKYHGAISTDGMSPGSRGGDIAKITDGDPTSSASFMKDPYEGADRDGIPADATLTMTFDSLKDIGSVYILQTTGGDKIGQAAVEYQNEEGTWIKIGEINNSKAEFTFDVSNENIKAKAIRIKNLVKSDKWWQLHEFEVKSPSMKTEGSYSIPEGWSIYSGNMNALTDNDPNTCVWFDSGQEDATQAGDAITYDYGKVISLDSVKLVMGNGTSGDKFVKYTIETSVDNKTWNTLPGYAYYEGKADGSDLIDAKVNGTIKARYVRVKNLEYKKAWVKVSDFIIKEKEKDVDYGSKELLFNNPKKVSSTLLSKVNDETLSLTAGGATLKPNEYVGLKFANNKEITSIVKDYVADSGIVLECSQNNFIWNEVKANGNFDARYFRFINKSDKTADLRIASFDVNVNDIQKPHLEASNIEINANWGDSRNNGKAFDKDMTTQTKFGGNPRKGQYILYDLGQEMDIASLRIYVSDNTPDFLRDANVQISTDKESWKDVFSIGDGVMDENRNGTATDAGWNTDSNYPNVRYVGNDELNGTGRYVRFLIPCDYNDRAVVINEIVINNGKYVPVENNRDFIGTLEKEGHQPSNMGDGDISTSYVPALENGEMTYVVSENTTDNAFRIIQTGEISNALVSAKLYKTDTQEIETKEFGTLSQSVNEFIVLEGYKLLSVSVEWKDKLPEIAEILQFTTDSRNVNKEELKKLLAEKPAAYDTWTQQSKAIYDERIQTGKDVLANENCTQSSVDTVVTLIQAAIDEAKVKADATALEQLVQDIIVNDKTYTIVSYNAYLEQIDVAKEALKDKENLDVETAENLVNNVQEAIDALVYSTLAREEAQLILDDSIVLDEETYTSASYKVYLKAKEALEQAIDKDKKAETMENRVSPKELRSLTSAYRSAVDALVVKVTLQEVVDEFETMYKEKADLYEETSFDAYQKAVEEGKPFLVNGTQEEINALAAKIIEKRGQLVANKDRIQAIIEDAKAIHKEDYTEASYNALMKIVAEVEGQKDLTREEYTKYAQEITDAKTSLVNVKSLKVAISQVSKFDKDTYTKASYANVEAALKYAKNVLKAGSAEEVEIAIEKISKAVSSLEISAQKEYDAYKENLTLKDKNKYTEDSYKAYKEAYDKFMNLGSDVSVKEYTMAKSALEEAEKALVLKSDKLPETDTDDVTTGVQANVAGFAMITFISLCALVVFFRKKEI